MTKIFISFLPLSVFTLYCTREVVRVLEASEIVDYHYLNYLSVIIQERNFKNKLFPLF